MRSVQSIINRGFDPANSGYRITYHREASNHCPGCGKSHWHLGRSSAQCAFCDTALPFAENTAGMGRTALYA